MREREDQKNWSQSQEQSGPTRLMLDWQKLRNHLNNAESIPDERAERLGGRKGIGSARKQLSQTAIKAAANRRVWPRPGGSKGRAKARAKAGKAPSFAGGFIVELGSKSAALGANSCEPGCNARANGKKAGVRNGRVRTLRRSTYRPSGAKPKWVPGVIFQMPGHP